MILCEDEHAHVWTSVKNWHLSGRQNHLLIIQMDFSANTGGGKQ